MIDPQLKAQAVEIYKNFFDNTEDGQTLWPLVTGSIKVRPEDWWVIHHDHSWGRYMRDMLPEGTTWDDYYVELIEIALGFKDMEGNRIEKAYDKTHVHSLFISTTVADLIGLSKSRNPRAG